MRYLTMTALLLLLLLSGCGDYWTARGDAARRSAEAAITRAQADREAAEASVLEAQGALALDQAQAGALTALADVNTEIMEEAIRLAGRRPDGDLLMISLIMAGLTVASSTAIAVTALRKHAPAPPPAPAPPGQIIDVERLSSIRIETPQGIMVLEQEPGETRYHFLIRARDTVELLGGGRLLGPGR